LCGRAGDATVRSGDLTKRARPYYRMGMARASSNSMRQFRFSVNRESAWLKAFLISSSRLRNPLIAAKAMSVGFIRQVNPRLSLGMKMVNYSKRLE
jgi:hypothetical protein